MLEIRIVEASASETLHICSADTPLAKEFAELKKHLTRQHSQWLYFERSLTVFDGNRTYLFKPLERLSWLPSQALNDAADLIVQNLVRGAGLMGIGRRAQGGFHRKFGAHSAIPRYFQKARVYVAQDGLRASRHARIIGRRGTRHNRRFGPGNERDQTPAWSAAMGVQLGGPRRSADQHDIPAGKNTDPAPILR